MDIKKHASLLSQNLLRSLSSSIYPPIATTWTVTMTRQRCKLQILSHQQQRKLPMTSNQQQSKQPTKKYQQKVRAKENKQLGLVMSYCITWLILRFTAKVSLFNLLLLSFLPSFSSPLHAYFNTFVVAEQDRVMLSNICIEAIKMVKHDNDNAKGSGSAHNITIQRIEAGSLDNTRLLQGVVLINKSYPLLYFSSCTLPCSFPLSLPGSLRLPSSAVYIFSLSTPCTFFVDV